MIDNPHVPDDEQLEDLIGEVGILDLNLTELLEDGPKDLTNDRAVILDQMLHRSDSFKTWLSARITQPNVFPISCLTE